ncbi:MAG: four helix bundle protein [Bacteroidota bacterium]|nr:four helix bundle protein [Bacteroidota bacterium]
MTEKNYLKISQIEAYNISKDLSNFTWDIVLKWDYFARDTVGKQFVRAVDSISANIAEGFGRFHKKVKIKFFQYSKGSVLESYDWTEKSKHRNLITEDEYNELLQTLQKLPKSINSLIKYTNDNLTI